MKRWEKTKTKADSILKTEGLGESNKLQQIQKLYKKADKRKTKGTPTYVVAKKGGGSITVKPKGGNKGGPRGKLKLVDSRMKKDMRAERRAEKRKKGGARFKGAKKGRRQ